MAGQIFPGAYSPIPGGFQSISVSNAAVSQLTVPSVTYNPATPFGPAGIAKLALIQCLGANVNWRDDGVNPTATSPGGGMFLNASDDPEVFMGNLLTVRFVSIAAGGSTLLVSYYA